MNNGIKNKSINKPLNDYNVQYSDSIIKNGAPILEAQAKFSIFKNTNAKNSKPLYRNTMFFLMNAVFQDASTFFLEAKKIFFKDQIYQGNKLNVELLKDSGVESKSLKEIFNLFQNNKSVKITEQVAQKLLENLNTNYDKNTLSQLKFLLKKFELEKKYTNLKPKSEEMAAACDVLIDMIHNAESKNIPFNIDMFNSAVQALNQTIENWNANKSGGYKSFLNTPNMNIFPILDANFNTLNIQDICFVDNQNYIYKNAIGRKLNSLKS